MNITPKRKKILDTLEKHHGVISARDLAARLHDQVDQATVYRNLDLFVKQGLVKKFVFEGNESMYEFAHHDHHHAVCSDCDELIHFTSSDQEIIEMLNIKNFDVSSVELVVRGKHNFN